jgi:hypothetical protein
LPNPPFRFTIEASDQPLKRGYFMRIIGKATAVATQSYFRQHPIIGTSAVADLGWQISQVGFGSYRVSLGDKTQEQALRQALQSGINLVDTSSNYGDGGAERLIGRVLGELIDSGDITAGAGGRCLKSWLPARV